MLNKSSIHTGFRPGSDGFCGRIENRSAIVPTQNDGAKVAGNQPNLKEIRVRSVR